MSWCRLNTLVPVIASTIASMTGRAVSEMGPYLFEDVSSFLSRQRLDQLLLGRRQDTLEPDDEEIADPVAANVLGSPAHVFLFEARDPCADGGFDFPLCPHGGLERGRILARRPHGRLPAQGDRTTVIVPSGA
jgi:hypothetical protein